MKFKCFKYRERSKTKVEVILFAIRYNLRKYFHKKVQRREGMELYRLAVTQVLREIRFSNFLVQFFFVWKKF